MKELEQKYFILKQEDISKYLSNDEMYALHDMSTKISDARKVAGKKDNEYVVLNLDDTINVVALSGRIRDLFDYNQEILTKQNLPLRHPESYTFREIAPIIINSIVEDNPWKVV